MSKTKGFGEGKSALAVGAEGAEDLSQGAVRSATEVTGIDVDFVMMAVGARWSLREVVFARDRVYLVSRVGGV